MHKCGKRVLLINIKNNVQIHRAVKNNRVFLPLNHFPYNLIIKAHILIACYIVHSADVLRPIQAAPIRERSHFVLMNLRMESRESLFSGRSMTSLSFRWDYISWMQICNRSGK